MLVALRTFAGGGTLPRLHPLLRCYYRRRLFLFRLVTVLQTRRLAQATRDLK